MFIKNTLGIRKTRNKYILRKTYLFLKPPQTHANLTINYYEKSKKNLLLNRVFNARFSVQTTIHGITIY